MNAPLQSKTVSIDACTEGWYASYSLDNMPANAAIVLDNLIPGMGQVESRGGWLEYGDLGTDAPVETVCSFRSLTYTQLVAASAGGLWYVEDGPVTQFGTKAAVVNQIAPPGTYLRDKWQTANFTKLDEEGVLIMCNGEDLVQIYNGVGAPNDIVITGTDPSLSLTPDFIGVCVFKGRAYYWKETDNAFYYTQAGSYQGEFQKFDLGGVTTKGGSIKFITDWTQQDAGGGKDDLLVIMFDTGEILLYQGDDPESTGFFEIVGKYSTGEPLSIRGYSQYGSDSIIMTQDGYVNLASVIQQGRTSDVSQFSRLIYNAVAERAETRGHLYGWECTLFPRQGLFIFNVPLSIETFEQHVMNTVTQKWCRFKDLNVNCWAVHDEQLYAGAQDGKVHWMLETTSDNGNSILFTALPAFNYFGNQGIHKHIVAANVISTYSQPENIEITGYSDFNLPPALPDLNVPPRYTPSTWALYPATYPPWNPPLPGPPYPDQSVVGSYWDEDYWSAETTPFTTQGWQSVSAFGYAVTVLIRFAEGSDPVIWRATNIRYYEAGAQ
mgnify:CR=1 FL=1